MKRGRGRPPKHKHALKPLPAPSNSQAIPDGITTKLETYEGPLQEPPQHAQTSQRMMLPWESHSGSSGPNAPHPPSQMSRQDIGGRENILCKCMQNLSEKMPSAMVLSSALLWHCAYMELNTLGNRQWLDSLVCDFYLASIWHDNEGDARCRFLMIFQL